jgi:hypothetical protein
MTSELLRIDLSRYEPGLYLVYGMNGNKSVNKKLVLLPD